MQLISRALVLPRTPVFCLFSPLPLTCLQQASLWTRTGCFISWMAPPSERWTATASSPLSWAPTTWPQLVRSPVTTAWTSTRWPRPTSCQLVRAPPHAPDPKVYLCSFTLTAPDAAMTEPAVLREDFELNPPGGTSSIVSHVHSGRFLPVSM